MTPWKPACASPWRTSTRRITRSPYGLREATPTRRVSGQDRMLHPRRERWRRSRRRQVISSSRLQLRGSAGELMPRRPRVLAAPPASCRVLSHFSCPAVSPSHADTVSSRSLSRTACADSPTSVQERSFRTFPAVNAPNLIGSLSTSLMPQRRVSVASSLAPRQVQVLEVAGIGHEVVGATDETAKESVVGGDPSSSWVRFHLLGVPVGVLASPTLRRSLLVAFIPRAPSHHVDRG
jgi:hypothetical protein